MHNYFVFLLMIFENMPNMRNIKIINSHEDTLWLLLNIFFGDVVVAVEGLPCSVLLFHCATILLKENVCYLYLLLFSYPPLCFKHPFL